MNEEMEAKNQEYIDDAANRMTAREAEALHAELEQARAHLGNLLATIHQDGGQYQQDNGTEQAVNDAVAKWHERTRRIDELEEAARWIPANERLPGRDESYPWSTVEVEVWDGYDIRSPAFYYLDDLQTFGWKRGQWRHEDKAVIGVTHWRPLPEPPQ